MKQPKPRKCKAKGCTNTFIQRNSFEVVCSLTCAINEGKRREELKRVKDLRLQKQLDKVRFKELKEKTVKYKVKTQSKVQEIARLIDYGQPCLAKQYIPKKADGGHVFSRKGNENFAMNLHNIFLQSAQSNHFQNDDGLMRDGVVRVFGEEYLEFIHSLKSTPVVKYSNEEWHEIYKRACSISNSLKKTPQISDSKNRIGLRNTINLELGIYPKEYLIFKPI